MDNRKVIRSAGTVGFFVLISRIFGLIRDMAMAACFGTSLSMSAFVVAFTIPNLFRSLFGEGAMSSAFVPVFTETRTKYGSTETWAFASRMSSVLSVILACLVLLGIIITSFLLHRFPDMERLVIILDLLRILLPYMFFICMAALFAAMLNSMHMFMLPAATPAVLNIVIIATLLGICPFLDEDGYTRIKAVAWAVILAGLIQWLMLLPPLMTKGFRMRFTFDWHDTGLRKVRNLMGVVVLGVGVTRLNVLTDRLLATFISQSSPAYLYFAERLIYFPLGIFATALGTVLLPAFSGHAARDQLDEMLETFNSAMRHLMFMMMPAAAGMMVLAGPIVRLIYERGDFTSTSTRMTMLALMCYAPGLIMFGMIKVLIPLFYARQDMKTPVRIGVLCTGLNILLSLTLMWPFKHLGIAIATVISATVHVILLVVLVHRKIGSPGWIKIGLAFLRMACAVAVMSMAAMKTHSWIYRIADPFRTSLQQTIALCGAIAIGALVYLLCAFLFRCTEPVEIWHAVRKRGRKA